jgi:hypothetical protein
MTVLKLKLSIQSKLFVTKKQMLKHKDNENAFLKQKKPNHKDNLNLSPEIILTIS